MSAHVLLNALNKLRKRDKCMACQAFYCFLIIKFSKVNITGTLFLDFILISHNTKTILFIT